MCLITLIKEDLRQDEGLKLKPYVCTAGKLTIGYGRNLEDRGISRQEAEMFLDNDVSFVYKRLEQEIDLERHPAHVRRALVNMAFQLGVDGLLKFKNTLKLVDAGDYEAAANQAMKSLWAKQTPKRAKRITDIMKGKLS